MQGNWAAADAEIMKNQQSWHLLDSKRRSPGCCGECHLLVHELDTWFGKPSFGVEKGCCCRGRLEGAGGMTLPGYTF